LRNIGVHVLVPALQRYAVHKLIVSRRRKEGSAKRIKIFSRRRRDATLKAIAGRKKR
jgi:hypothetical protein